MNSKTSCGISGNIPVIALISLTFAAGLGVGRYGLPFQPARPADENPAASSANGSSPTNRSSSATRSQGSPVRLNQDADTVIARLMALPEQDVVGVVAAISTLPSLTTPQLREAYARLIGNPPRMDYVGSMTMGYVWHRMLAIEPDTPFPETWGMESMREILTNRDRLQVDAIEARLTNKEEVSPFERKWYFIEQIAKNPVQALAKWRKFSDVEGNHDELALFGPAFMEESNRKEMMRHLLEPGAQPGSDTGHLIAALASNWMAGDFAAAEQWGASELPPTLQPAFTAALLKHLATNEPETLLSWRPDLPEGFRQPAMNVAISRLAASRPDMIKDFLGSIKDPEVRKSHTETFSLYHSMADYPKWKEWRANLEPEAADIAAVAGFETWLNRDPAEASAWLAGKPPGETRTQLISLMANRLIHEDRNTIISWVASLADPADRTTAISSAIRGADPDDLRTQHALMLLAK